MTPRQLINAIGAGKYEPVYYFYGEEDYRKTEAVKYIVNNFLPKQQQLLNYTRLSTVKNDFETIVNEVAAIPMLGERRVLLIDEIQRFKPNQQKKFYAFLKQVPAEMIIILASPAAHTPDRKSAFLRDVRKVAEVVKFDRLGDEATKSRIARHLKAAGYTFDAEAIDLLTSMTGGDFGGLMGELEKLTLFSEERTHIGLEEVKRLVSSHEDFTIFELIDLIAEGRTDRALYVADDLMQRGIKPVPILRLLSGHMTKLAKIIAGKKVPGHPFFVDKLRKQARIFDRERVARAITKIAEADRDVRRSKIDDDILLENMIREICR